MNRDYIDWLETLPCNRKPQKVNVWMGGWAPLPEEIDLADCEAWQDREIQRNHYGLMARLSRWVRVKAGSDWAAAFPAEKAVAAL